MKSAEVFFVHALLGLGVFFGTQTALADNIEPYHTKTKSIDVYQSKTVEPVNARTIAPDRGGNIMVERSSSQPHVFTKEEREEMHRNDVAAGRTYESMSKGSHGKGSCSQSRLNHYSNMQNLQRRMDQSGTIGYNPYRNE